MAADKTANRAQKREEEEENAKSIHVTSPHSGFYLTCRLCKTKQRTKEQ